MAIQVKAINGHAWQFDVRKFLDVHMDEDGKHQIIGAPQQEPFPDLICVLVLLKESGQDRFFILEWKQLQNLVVKGHTEYLSKHNFVRPRVPDSFHTSLDIVAVEPFENEWRRILDRMP